ncbi:MAG: lipid II flippase MurJ [Bacteroidota bacterium]
MKDLIKSSLIVVIVIGIGKILGFVRDIIISSYYGSTYITDSYFIATSIPGIVFTAIISSYLALLIPTYKRIQVEKGEKAVNLFVTRILIVFTLFSVAVTIFGYIYMAKIIGFLVPNLTTKSFILTLDLARILIFSLPLTSIVLIIANISNANNKYYAPHINAIISSLFIVVCVVFFNEEYGIFIVAYSAVSAYIISLMAQIIISGNDIKIKFKLPIIDSEIKKLTYLTIPIFIGISIDQIVIVVTNYLSANLAEGSLSYITYANRLQLSVYGVFSLAISTVVYPKLSSLHAQHKQEGFIKLKYEGLKIILLAVVPLATFLAFNAHHFVSLVYLRGNFNIEDSYYTGSIFVFFAINIVFLSLKDYYLRILYVKEKTKLVLIANVFSVIVFVLLSFYLSGIIGVIGIAIGMLASTIVSFAILLAFSLKTTGISFYNLHSEITKQIKFNISLFVVVLFFFSYVEMNMTIWAFMLKLLIFCVFYLICFVLILGKEYKLMQIINKYLYYFASITSKKKEKE